jgi:hypothetical protein
MKKLQLYVWENVLTDYTDGVMFALASSEIEARKLLRKELGETQLKYNEHVLADLAKRPRKITAPEAFAVYGGG